MAEGRLPPFEEQQKLVEQADKDLRAIVNEWFPKDEAEHKPFRSMVGKLLPQMRDTPASGTTRYHSAWTGGLLVHTVNVIQFAVGMTERLVEEPAIRDGVAFTRSVIKCCYLHDLGKLGDGENPYYLPQENEWRKNNLGEMFTLNRDQDELTFLPVPVRSLYLAQKFGVSLTPDEIQAIIASDGPGTAHGKQVVSTFLELPLTMVVHFADKWVSMIRAV